jgi:hypothetical protein
VREVLLLDDPALEPYTPDGFVQALAVIRRRAAPSTCSCPHLPDARLRAGARGAAARPLVTDVIGVHRR